jgi:hypothetical protein
VFDLVSKPEQLAIDPQLLQRPADLRLPQPDPAGRLLGHLRQVPNRRLALHRMIMPVPAASVAA